MILAGGYAIRDAWLSDVVGEEVAQMSPTELMADLFDTALDTKEEDNDAPAPDVLPPENTTPPAQKNIQKDVLPEEKPADPIEIPEDRIELIIPTETPVEPEVTLEELLEENGVSSALPSSGPRKMPRPSGQ